MELPPSTAMRYTALLVLSAQEAYVAGSEKRTPLGPNGEWHLARLLHTTDGGRHWQALPWHRPLRPRLRHPGFPNWPPEFVLGIYQSAGRLVITHRDEWVPFEPGGESLWEASFDGRSWRVRFLRLMDYEREDNPTPLPEIDLSSLPLPIQRTIRPPKPNGANSPDLL